MNISSGVALPPLANPSWLLLKTRTFPTPSGVEKQTCYGVGRHSPVAAGGEADAAYLWAVGEAGAFELLGEEAVEEGAEPFADGGAVVAAGEGFLR